LTGVQGMADHELCVLPRIWLVGEIFTQKCAPKTHQSVCEFSRNTMGVVGRQMAASFSELHTQRKTTCLFVSWCILW